MQIFYDLLNVEIPDVAEIDVVVAAGQHAEVVVERLNRRQVVVDAHYPARIVLGHVSKIFSYAFAEVE